MFHIKTDLRRSIVSSADSKSISMKLAEILREYGESFEHEYGGRLLPSHRQAINAILACRTPAAGEMIVLCPHCGSYEWRPNSCGNRNCPGCQNHENDRWLNRQLNKLLPVPYFLVTFTVPAILRKIAWNNQRIFFDCLFDASASTLQTFAGDGKFLGARLGMTGVLHTNSRKLDFHPHVHYIVPAGGLDQKQRFWKRTKNGNYLFPQRAMTRMFQARLMALLREKNIGIPDVFSHGDWVVHCRRVGSGAPVLKYLARYLYRGVISEKRIIYSQNGLVKYAWRDGKTRKWKTKSVRAEAFLWKVLQHALPRGFRRVRDYGFLHGNARRILTLIQLLLNVQPVLFVKKQRPAFICGKCGCEMTILGFIKRGNLKLRAPPAA